VCSEIGSQLKAYTDFDQLEIEVENWDVKVAHKNYEVILNENECKDLIALLLKV
jgi:hypothetical protein